MSYPTLYAVTYSYTGFQQSQGDNSFPGTQLDADLAGLQASIDSVDTFMQLAIRSDGALNNGIVTFDSLSAALQSNGLAGASPWATGINYSVGIPVIQNFALYRAAVAHTSGVFATDLAAGKWTLVAALPQGPSGTLTVGVVSTLAAGAPATVANAGTAQAATFNFGIPQGVQGVQGNTGLTGSGYGGTSATSLLIANGVTKVFATQAGLAYQVGSYVRASSAANGANFMEGVVSAYAGTSLSINVSKIGGAGTFADWGFNMAGAPGTGDLLSTNNLSDLTNAGTARTNLGLAIGANVQAFDAQLFSNIPQNSKSAAYTTVASDAQKHIFHPDADVTARTWTIDSNANVPYPIGTAITFINGHGAGVLTIAITTDTMRLAGAGTTGSRTLAADGMATAIKITATEWKISGTGLT